jgi:hypothetical protein
MVSYQGAKCQKHRVIEWADYQDYTLGFFAYRWLHDKPVKREGGTFRFAPLRDIVISIHCFRERSADLEAREQRGSRDHIIAYQIPTGKFPCRIFLDQRLKLAGKGRYYP